MRNNSVREYANEEFVELSYDESDEKYWW
jgi:hypothetical protein